MSTSPRSNKVEVKENGSKEEEKSTEAPEPQTEPSGSVSSPKSETKSTKEAADEEDDELPEPGPVPKDHSGIIEMETFQQIRDMDDDEDEEFSRGIVWGFFEQAEKTFLEMQDALRQKDLGRLSSLGHFLKGSSAALGIIKVQAICEKIQHYGHKQDEDQAPIEEKDALERIKNRLKECKQDYVVAKAWLVNLYEDEE